MARQELPEKMFYSIAEVAQYYDIPDSTLRFWEKNFSIIAPKRSDNKRKIRLYTPKDVHNIGLIYHLLKVKGLTIPGAQEELRKNRGKIERRVEAINRLYAIRAELSAMSQELGASGESPVVADVVPQKTSVTETIEHIPVNEENEAPIDFIDDVSPEEVTPEKDATVIEEEARCMTESAMPAEESQEAIDADNHPQRILF